MKKRIFIQITSYHDYELEKTIRNAILKSSGEVALKFGVHSIFVEDNSWIEGVRRIPDVKLIESKAPENLGMGIGRLLADGFYSGEDYYLQIDAHSRFDQNWDRFLIDEVRRHKADGFKKPIITNYPKPFWYDGDKEKTRDHLELPLQFCWKDRRRFELYRTPMQGTVVNRVDNVFSISVSGGCIFTEGEFLRPNKLIFADGEEIFMAARAYTNGYDLFVPTRMFMYHLYTELDSAGNNKRRLVPSDWPSETARLEQVSKDEIMLTLSGEGTIGEYRLGAERTLGQYGEFAGLDFKAGQILRNFENEGDSRGYERALLST